MTYRDRTRWRPRNAPRTRNIHTGGFNHSERNINNRITSTKYSQLKPPPKTHGIRCELASNQLFKHTFNGKEYLSLTQSKKQLINILTKQKQIVCGYIGFISHLIPQVINELIIKYYNERIDIFMIRGSLRGRCANLHGIQYLDLVHQQNTPLYIHSANDPHKKSTQNINWDNSQNALVSFIPNIKLHADTYRKYRKCFNYLQFDSCSSSQFSCIIKANINIGTLSMIMFPNMLHDESNYNESLHAVEIPLRTADIFPISTLKSRSTAIKKADRHLICMFASHYLYECKINDTEHIAFNALGENRMNYRHEIGGNLCYIGSNQLFISGPNYTEMYNFYTDEYEDISHKVPQRINMINDSAMFWNEHKEHLYIGGSKAELHNKVQYWNMYKDQWFELPECGSSHFENPLLFSFNHSPSIICIAGNYASNCGVVEYFDFRVHTLQWLTAPNDLQLTFWRNGVNIYSSQYSRIRSMFM